MVKAANYLWDLWVSSLARSLDFSPQSGECSFPAPTSSQKQKWTLRQGETKKQKPSRKLGVFPTWAITVSGVLLLVGVAM